MRQPIPFGPFLSLAALEYFFGGDRLMRAYLGLFEP
jgi:prepilin signal peptidase PulO-like enzyme (type II secretory pathway)